MKKWNLIVDVKKCVGCYNCFLSCKDEHIGNDFPGYSKQQPAHGHKWIDIKVIERGQIPFVDITYVPTMCNHCDDAPCIKTGAGAVYKRNDGIVIIDPERSKGRKDIVSSCPYGAIYWNDAEQVPQAWYFDAHLLDQGWKETRCSQVCPTGAIATLKVTDDEMQDIAAEQGLTGLVPHLQTRPRVHYKNMESIRHVFVAGTVVAEDEGIKDAVQGASIYLYRNKQICARAMTDNYGDFKIDGISSEGRYRLEVTKEGYRHHVCELELERSLSIGTIIITTNTQRGRPDH